MAEQPHYQDLIDAPQEGVNLLDWMNEKYNSFLKGIGVRAADTAWKASFTGIGKGLLFTVAAVVLVHAAYGGFAGHAVATGAMTQGVQSYGNGMASGMVTGALEGLMSMFSTGGVALLALGGLIGYATDSRAADFDKETQVAQQRQQARTQGAALSPQPELAQQQEASMDYVHPPAGWAEKVKGPHRPQGGQQR